MDDTIRIADIVPESVVDGLGIRMTVFVQGCNHHCKGCHNSLTWDFNGGKVVKLEELIKIFKSNPLLDGMTFSGGEPFEQPAPLYKLAEFLHSNGFNVWCYTGYTLEELLSKAKTDNIVSDLLNSIDVLVDGEFIEDKKNLMLKFRGSENQRIIDMAKTKSLDYKQIIWLNDMQ